jgi:diketogulonate reductase-like aldo/keto reductase
VSLQIVGEASAIGSIWGVSNFNVSDMEGLFRVADGHRCVTNQVPCVTNQVPYSLNNRRVERDLLPWCKQHHVPIMAYSPLGGDNNLVIHDHTLAQIGAAHGCSAAAVALAWVIRNGNVIAIPETADRRVQPSDPERSSPWRQAIRSSHGRMA